MVRARDRSRVGAARACHALEGGPGAKRRPRRAPRVAPGSRSQATSGVGVAGAHGSAVPLEADGTVDDAVEDGVGEGRILELSVPVGHGQLRGDDHRAAAEAIVEDLVEVVAAGSVDWGQPQVVQ